MRPRYNSRPCGNPYGGRSTGWRRCRCCCAWECAELWVKTAWCPSGWPDAYRSPARGDEERWVICYGVTPLNFVHASPEVLRNIGRVNFQWEWMGLRYLDRHFPSRTSRKDVHLFWLILPIAWPTFIAALLPAARAFAWWRARRRKPPAPGICPRCSYDLRATPGRCPECGTVLNQGARRQNDRKFQTDPLPDFLLDC